LKLLPPVAPPRSAVAQLPRRPPGLLLYGVLVVCVYNCACLARVRGDGAALAQLPRRPPGLLLYGVMGRVRLYNCACLARASRDASMCLPVVVVHPSNDRRRGYNLAMMAMACVCASACSNLSYLAQVSSSVRQSVFAAVLPVRLRLASQ